MKFDLGGVENIVGKGENVGYHFLPLPQCFKMATFSRSLKVGNIIKYVLTLFQTSPGFYVSAVQVF